MNSWGRDYYLHLINNDPHLASWQRPQMENSLSSLSIPMHGAYLQFSILPIFKFDYWYFALLNQSDKPAFFNARPALVVAEAVIIVLHHFAVVVQVPQHRVLQQLLRVFLCWYSRSITDKISNILKSMNHSFLFFAPHLAGPRAVVGWPPNRGSTQKARGKDVVDLLCLQQKPSTIYFDPEILLTRWSNFECKRKRSGSYEGWCDSTSFWLGRPYLELSRNVRDVNTWRKVLK